MLCFEILPKTKYEIKIEALKSDLFECTALKSNKNWEAVSVLFREILPALHGFRLFFNVLDWFESLLIHPTSWSQI